MKKDLIIQIILGAHVLIVNLYYAWYVPYNEVTMTTKIMGSIMFTIVTLAFEASIILNAYRIKKVEDFIKTNKSCR